jgi:hypothetical protein
MYPSDRNQCPLIPETSGFGASIEGSAGFDDLGGFQDEFMDHVLELDPNLSQLLNSYYDIVRNAAFTPSRLENWEQSSMNFIDSGSSEVSSVSDSASVGNV